MLLVLVVGAVLSVESFRDLLEQSFAFLSVLFHDHLACVLSTVGCVALLLKLLMPSASTDDSKKQGAYGSIVIHKESKIAQLSHPWEVLSAVKMLVHTKVGGGKQLPTNLDADTTWCFKMVKKVSRSFAMVIIALPDELRLSICVFYLALRALDTVEDDMKRIDNKTKIEMLQKFYLRLSELDLSIHGIGEGDEATVLEQAGHMNRALASLPKSHQDVIIDITRKMGAGMAEFVEVDMGQGTVKTADYDKYCYYVAGLVGEGLSRLFSASGLEHPSVGEKTELSISMGQFLQKVNIIRDYLEDFVEGRTFWPQEIWKKHMGNLGDMRDDSKREASLNCLNEMVFDALRHIPDCMTYLAAIRNPDVFFFCAMPQVMAVATLAQLYNNPKVFTGVVKIRKGTACFLMEHATSMPKVRGMFSEYVHDIQAKGVSAERVATLHAAIDAIHADALEAPNMGSIVFLAFSSLVAAVLFLVSTRGLVLPPLTDAIGVGALATMFGSVAVLLAFGFTPFATPTKKTKTD
ncbi:hypothetical protein SPRG_06233 [Saprolegnia parasitica CBS 223.65]|uniref:Squalene synthase n=1 Tax=Saprolegnia parasitica (strain CBS 223.65) TaxID=695850 RepID=A0A067CGC3_SAPPC|nr:hypothetical protein SPRG_06233 [Saprolegnia parasitica CBS 223.65]KDO28185.1 hypothetical protein SPRG_06233 [Saprolegnia parasitica CBS 223.65]|eukprot:XP_012201011.1 hypothetical protein SPRG_06233 [Saprolegnia parasitica CBS 223.65]